LTNIQGSNRGTINSIGGVAAGLNKKTGAVASRALGGIAGKMADTISAALSLGGEDDEPDFSQGGSDPYEIEEVVEALAGELSGGPKEKGALSRSLHEFVQEGAALFLARPESRSLAFIERVIASGQNNDAPADLASVTDAVEHATIMIKAALS
jgi:hypothetical protein